MAATSQTCNCAEGFVEVYRGGVRERRRIAAPHDCAYIAARNALTPEATQIANRQASSGLGLWSTLFSVAMERLVRERIFKR